jgi:hypothetical protein
MVQTARGKAAASSAHSAPLRTPKRPGGPRHRRCPGQGGCSGDRSSLGSARGEDPSTLRTCPPGGSPAGRAPSGRQRRTSSACGTRLSEIQAVYDSLWANARETICTWGPAGNSKTLHQLIPVLFVMWDKNIVPFADDYADLTPRCTALRCG